jgi:hypothetical protein
MAKLPGQFDARLAAIEKALHKAFRFHSAARTQSRHRCRQCVRALAPLSS